MEEPSSYLTSIETTQPHTDAEMPYTLLEIDHLIPTYPNKNIKKMYFPSTGDTTKAADISLAIKILHSHTIENTTLEYLTRCN